jgi:hypothetical protein
VWNYIPSRKILEIKIKIGPGRTRLKRQCLKESASKSNTSAPPPGGSAT